MNAIKLNPSQTLRLVDERKKFFSNRAQNSDVTEKEKIFFTAPLICVLEENFSREDFLSMKKISIYEIKKMGNAFFFPCEIELPQSKIFAPLPCATLFKNDFSLEDFFLDAKKIARDLKTAFCNENDFFFAPTSLKFCQAEFNKNTWQLHGELWKKIK
ncbi:MAG: hypothetical protein K2J68_02150 [Treponemataceae bacterium]|nr:hypothetical protein [Treponemataceae bacterium]